MVLTVIGSLSTLMIPLGRFVGSRPSCRALAVSAQAHTWLFVASFLPLAAFAAIGFILLRSRMDQGRWPIAIGVHPDFDAPWAEPVATYPGAWLATVVLVNCGVLSVVPFSFCASFLRGDQPVRAAGVTMYAVTYVALAAFVVIDPGGFAVWFFD